MPEHLTSLQSSSVTTDASTEIILRDGQTMQLTASGLGLFDRTRGFRFRRQGLVADLELVFDGSNLTLYAIEQNVRSRSRVARMSHSTRCGTLLG